MMQKWRCARVYIYGLRGVLNAWCVLLHKSQNVLFYKQLYLLLRFHYDSWYISRCQIVLNYDYVEGKKTTT